MHLIIPVILSLSAGPLTMPAITDLHVPAVETLNPCLNEDTAIESVKNTAHITVPMTARKIGGAVYRITIDSLPEHVALEIAGIGEGVYHNGEAVDITRSSSVQLIAEDDYSLATELALNFSR